MINSNTRRGGRRWGLRALAVAGLALPLAACDLDSLLEVEDPDVVTPRTLADSAAIDLRKAGMLNDFTWAFSGSSLTGGLVPYSGLFSDELYNPDTFDTRFQIDRRAIDANSNGEARFPYRYLHRSRIQAIQTAGLVEQFEGTDSPNYALSKTIEGYTELLLGEVWCSGVPFSQELEGGAIEYGQPLTTKQIFERAVATFNAALAVAPNYDLAKVGKARAQLALGDLAGASATAATVANGFEYYVQHSANSPNQENAMWALQNNRRLSIPPSSGEGSGGNTINFLNDPRVPWHNDPRLGFDGITPLRVQDIYTERASDVLLASKLEARLIQAEAALNKGASAAYLDIINPLRAAEGLAALTDPGTAQGRVDQFFTERAFFLYLTGHRMGDLRRLIQHYGRTEDQVFPTGNYHKGGLTYDDQTAFPIPVEEKNNPNFTQCLPNSGF